MGSKNWQEIATAKREAILASIPKEYIIPDLPTPEQQRDVTGTFVHKYLSPQEIEITETDAPGIVAKTTTGEWTAVEVTKAFIHRACIAHQLTNCLHETAFPAALASAAALDAHFSQTRTPLGPLHGLPISLKDQFHVRGLETSMGYVGWLGTFEGHAPPHPNYPIATESALVTILRSLGAVIYVKTAVPHTLMCGETVNNIIGYTLSPTNRLLSSGGSSGGEGALIALKGSPLGLGTDIGGSIRIPAAFNGVYGLRPSTGRLPYEGMANSMAGQNSVLSVVGPLAGSVGALQLLVKAVLSAAQPWRVDPAVVELPWRAEKEENTNKKLTFGLLRDDGVVRVTPPVARALSLAADKLRAAGHTVVEWTPPAEASHAAIVDCCARTWTYDGGRDTISAFALSGEPQAEHVQMPWPAPLASEATATEIAANNVRQRRLQKAYLDYWNGTDVDVIISPVAPFPAARPKQYKYYGYSMWVNLLDYTSVVVPVTRASKEVDRPVGMAEFEPRSELERETQESYDPDIYDGAPVALQFVGRRLEEEKMLKVAEVVDAVLKG
ncbi:General amidase [Lasiodiplodia theobromae]|uniref:General amidase n=1 Tax=Lasiodiplodia theobromae TaxID=45133 RepID=UPI0015C37FE3|nr:General amidase [Lasiodiplodia theobromae]KAF4543218.1 General amidase [Lasiodiplodia theobromae]